MFCAKCGEPNSGDALYCAKCGAPLEQIATEPPAAPVPARTSAKAVWSLLLSILAVGCFWIFTGIPAILLGLSAKRDIRQSQGRLSGDGLATAGIVLGALSFVFSMLPLVGCLAMLAMPNFLEAQARAKVSRARTDLRSLAVALEAYNVDNNKYPPSLHVLTTPIAYHRSLPTDACSAAANPTLYDYAADRKGRFWILRSVGPDQKPDLDLRMLTEGPAGVLEKGPVDPFVAITSSRYDPTNGTFSPGDILRTSSG